MKIIHKKQLKTSRILFLAMLTLVATACSKDDGPGNQNPKKAVLINPTNQAQDIEIENLNLQWQVATDPDGNDVSYDIYFGSENPPTTIVANNLNTTTYSLEAPLDLNQTYYWKVTAKDGNGGESQSEVGMFTTREATAEELIVGKWFLEEQLENGIPEPITDCEQNTYFQFSADDVLTIQEYHGEPCEADDIVLAQYSLPSETYVIITFQTTPINLTIISLTETELKLMASGGVQYNFIK